MNEARKLPLTLENVTDTFTKAVNHPKGAILVVCSCPKSDDLKLCNVAIWGDPGELVAAVVDSALQTGDHAMVHKFINDSLSILHGAKARILNAELRRSKEN